jgi:fucose 4-O-acetylase-like acetyltransferase
MLKQRDYSVDMLKFLLSIGVVYSHVFGGITNPDHDFMFCGFGFYGGVKFFIINGLLKFRVPLFAIISGYFFFSSGLDFPKYKQRLSKRVPTLLVPYLIWCTIALIVYSLGSYLKEGLSPLECYNKYGGFYGIYVNLHSTPMDAPLWYIRDLLLTAVISPLIYIVLKYFKIYALIGVGILYILGVSIPLISIGILFYFMLGAQLNMSHRTLHVQIKGKAFLYIGSVLLLIASIWMYKVNEDYYNYALRLYLIVGCYAVLSLLDYLKTNRFFIIPAEDKGPFSFFIYAIHYFTIVPILTLISYHVQYWNSLGYSIFFIILPLVAILLLYPIYLFMKKYTPRIFSLLLGQRKN